MKRLLLTLVVTLAFCGSMFAQSHYYTPVGYSAYGAFNAFVQINGEYVTGESDYLNLEVAAFVGDECKGTAFMDYFPEYDDPYPMVDLMIGYSDSPTNNEAGLDVTFRMYDHATETEYKICNPSVDIVTGPHHVEIMMGDYDNAVVLNFSVPTIPLTITGWEEYTGVWEEDNNRGGYHLIATPVDGVKPTEVLNMIGNNYDLYIFDQNEENEWRNYQALTDQDNFKLYMGTGYLYANKHTVTLEFTGTAMTDDYDVTLTKGSSLNWKGWNLVGNSFTEAVNVSRPFYKMNTYGDGFETCNEGGQVNPMEGIFVEATEDGEVMTFSLTAGKKEQPSLAVTLRSGNHDLDNAIVNFEQALQLHKMQFRQGSSQIYITMDDNDYAVVNAESMGELPVSFKAERNGNYNLSFNAEAVSFTYLHLIDNMTGADVDLLKTPSYSFDANVNDYASRFRLVFATGSSETESTFGFVNASGNLCIFGIEGDATLQVFDVTGRMLSSEQFEGSYEKQLNVAPGVYVMRLLNGENVRTQKIVIR